MSVLSLLGLLLVARPAGATRDPVDYRQALADDAAALAEALNQAGRHAEAIEQCRAFTRSFGPWADVLYEEAYARNVLGQVDRAREAYDAVIAAEAGHAAARYDRAELLIAADELDAAQADLQVVVQSRPDHWAVHLRLAEIAGRRGGAADFEQHLVAALQHGLDWQTLVYDPAWHELARSEAVGPVLKRLVTVYGDPATWDVLVGPVPE